MKNWLYHFWARLTGRASGARIFAAEGKGRGKLEIVITRANGKVERYLVDNRGQRRIRKWL